MRNTTEIYPNPASENGSKLTIVISTCLQAPLKIAQKSSYALLKIGRQTLLEKQINIVRQIYPNSEIIVIVGYDGKKIFNKLKRKNIRFVYNPNFDIANSLYDFGLALYNNLSPYILYIDGTVLFNQQAIEFISQDNKSKVLIDSTNKVFGYTGVTLDNSYKTTFFAIDLFPSWANIALFAQNELNIIEKYALDPNYHNHYLFEGMNKVINNGGIFMPHMPHEYSFLRIVDKQSLSLAKKIFK